MNPDHIVCSGYTMFSKRYSEYRIRVKPFDTRKYKISVPSDDKCTICICVCTVLMSCMHILCMM